MHYNINRTQKGIVQYPQHTHKNYEIMTYFEGDGYVQTEQGQVSFSRGTVVIVPPNIMHGSVSENGFLNVSIEGAFEGYLQLDRVVALTDNEAREGAALAKMIYDNRFGNPTYLSSLCTAYVCFLMQRIELGSSVQESVKRIMLQISQNAFDAHICLSGILSIGGYSEDYVRACFKKITGKTPNEYLTEIRIKHACFLIDIYKNSLPLSCIAERCGYLDYVYFSKKFKEETGVSPRRYRDH